MKLGQIVNPTFIATFGKIASACLPAEGLWKVKRIGKWLAEQQKNYDEVRMELCKRYADKDENGEPIMENNQFKGLEKNKEFLAEMQKLLDTELEIKVKFHMHEIENAEITGNDLMLLDELVFEPADTE